MWHQRFILLSFPLAKTNWKFLFSYHFTIENFFLANTEISLATISQFNKLFLATTENFTLDTTSQFEIFLDTIENFILDTISQFETVLATTENFSLNTTSQSEIFSLATTENLSLATNSQFEIYISTVILFLEKPGWRECWLKSWLIVNWMIY